MGKGPSHTARLLHCAWGIALTACIIPIPAEVDVSDGGVDFTPFVKSAIPAPPGGIDLPPDLSMTLEDGNIGDTLYLRAFRDYQATPYLDQTTVTNNPETGTIERVGRFLTNTWCNGATAGDYEFSVVVADRPFSDRPEVKPEYQAVTQNGRSTTTFWTFRCGGI
jgi:hypothetical protein